MSIFSKGHDAKFFWGINYCSTGKNDPNEPWFGRVYELVYLYPMGIDVRYSNSENVCVSRYVQFWHLSM